MPETINETIEAIDFVTVVEIIESPVVVFEPAVETAVHGFAKPFSAEAFQTLYGQTGTVNAIELMIYGMCGIFIFMTVFYLLVKVLERVFQNEANKE